MLTNLKLQLEAQGEKKILPQMSSNMHGLLMELVSPQYAAVLHQEGMRPYSQYLSFEEDKILWNINLLNDAAYREIAVPLLDENLRMLHLKKHDMDLKIVKRQMEQTPEESLAELFYRRESSRFFKLRFLTPAAFKQSGRYTFYPDLRCIYQSLMRKYSAVSDSEEFFDEDVLEQLVQDSEIVQYNVRSTSFHMEGVRIPSFTGWILIKTSGTQTMANYINMLLHFGEYSGIGIKTGIGMGAVKLMEREAKQRDR